MTDSKKTIKTPAELESENQKLLEELETPEEQSSEETPETKEEEVVEETPIVEEQEEEPQEQEEQAVPSPDYKKKFSESSREVQKKLAVNRKINQAIDEDVPEPTEEEMESLHSEWDVMDRVQKDMAVEIEKQKRFQSNLRKAREESKRIEKWDEDVLKFADDPQSLIDNPDLEGKLEEFTVYATQEKNNNVPFDVLVGSFLHQKSKETKPNGKGKMFPDGSGGPNENPKPKSDKISVAESEVLRQTDYDKYKEYLKAGKIDNTIWN